MPKLVAVLLCLAVCLPVSGAEKPWPQKGDVVFVSAELVGYLIALPGAVDSHRESPVPACVPMTVKKAKPDKRLWIIENPVKIQHRMEGPWIPEFHKSIDECRARYAERGDPAIVRSTWVHRIIPG